MDVTDALWYGELAPYELGGSLDEKQRALNRLIIENESELAPLLSEQAAAVPEKLSDGTSISSPCSAIWAASRSSHWTK